MTQYMVTSNTPGYLSEDDEPYVTDDLTSARMVLADEIQRDWDSEYEIAEDDAERADIDARYLDAHTAVDTLSPNEGVHVPAPAWQSHGLGRVYNLTIVEDDA